MPTRIVQIADNPRMKNGKVVELPVKSVVRNMEAGNTKVTLPEDTITWTSCVRVRSHGNLVPSVKSGGGGFEFQLAYLSQYLFSPGLFFGFRFIFLFQPEA